MNRVEAPALVRESVQAAVPGTDASALAPDRSLREQLDMDSLDFLGFLEALSKRAGKGLDEIDAADARTPEDFADLVIALTDHV
ncbi:acyl carrier protein [Embleya sp. NPDC059213]|uniref:acyl carrier protein n=1 Tax=Embleya sp. NPDC059213 TaxID=3346771 RepID=UPI0036B6ADEF